MRLRTASLAPASLVIQILLLSAAMAKAQGEKALLHVTSVRQEKATDWCDTGKCYATRFTVEGYKAAKEPNSVVKYIVECVEVVDTETGKTTLSCTRVQAAADYDVRIFPDAIVFQPVEPPIEGTVHAAYTIKSQKEEKK